MAYEYDIFISYKRAVETRAWIATHFEPLLSFYVELELGRAPVIFIDDKLEAGTDWPLDLGGRLAKSRVLVALYTKTYFYSPWCTRELGVMLARERAQGFRVATKPAGLIVPATLHDCEQLPTELASIQTRPLREWFNPRMRKDSERAERLADELAELAKPIASAIAAAPGWDSGWVQETADAFVQAFRQRQAPTQETVPGFAP